MNMQTKERKVYIDVLRIIACFFVIFNHTEGYILYSYAKPGSITYFIYLFLSIFSKISVPLFFMISGATLLHKKEDIRKIWLSRIVRIVVALTLFSFLYYLMDVKIGKESFNILRFFTVLITKRWVEPFWFLYMYIAFLMILPMLRALVQNLEDKFFIYWIILYLLWHISPLSKINNYFSLSGFSEMIIIYPSIGYFLAFRLNIFEFRKKILLLVLWLGNIALITYSCYLTYNKAVRLGDYSFSEEYHGLYVFINCITVFYTAWCIALCKKGNTKKRLNNCIIFLGSSTFGIYLWHSFLLERVSFIVKCRNALHSATQGWLDSMIFYIMYCVIIMCIGWIITLIIKRITKNYIC